MKKILLVEDEMLLATVAKATLEANGFVVEHASDGAKAWDTLSIAPLPDLVLTDLMMPRMSGDELISRIRETASTKNIPVILMSAATRETIEEKNIAAEAFIPKPFHANKLVETVQDLIGDGVQGHQ